MADTFLNPDHKESYERIMRPWKQTSSLCYD